MLTDEESDKDTKILSDRDTLAGGNMTGESKKAAFKKINIQTNKRMHLV